MKFYKKLGSKSWIVSFLSYLIKGYLVLVYKTTRWTWHQTEIRDELVAKKQNFIIAFWHGRISMMCFAWGPKYPKMHVLISLHRDGRIIARTMNILHLHVISGSSKRGGKEAIVEMLKVLKKGEYVTITPDGPKGPAMRVRSKIAQIAQEANVPIIPATFSTTNGIKLKTWDKHLFPLPFGKGVIMGGEPLYVPPDVEDTEPYKRELEIRLVKLTQEADRLCGHQPVLPDHIIIEGGNDVTKATKISLKRPFIWEKKYPEDIEWDVNIPKKPLYNLIDETAEQLGSREFLDFMDKKFTYKETIDLINQAAKGLQELGVKKDVKVGLFLPNTPYFVIFYFAILKAGGIVVNYNPLYVEQEIAHQIKDSDTSMMITLDLKALYDKIHIMQEQKLLQKVIVCPMTKILPFPKNILFPLVKGKEIAKVNYDNRRVVAFKDVVNNDGQFTQVKVNPEKDIAVMQYTGGTTGVPKGAMLSHYNLYANTLQCMKWFAGFTFGSETAMAVIPFFHVFAMTALMNLQIMAGSKLIMLPRFELDQTLKTIHKKKPTFFAAVPTIYNAINNHPERANFDLSSLRYCISGGAPLPVEVKNEFEEKSGAVLREGYGLTESSPVVAVNPVNGVSKAGSIGMPLPGTIVEVISLEDRKTPLGVGEKGEICISGPQVMMGYYEKPEATKESIINGRLHTGDVGYMDEDGYFFIVDRIKDMILVSGYNVYPRNIEDAIYQHPDVEECIVAGIADQYRGQTVKAYIKALEGKKLDENLMRDFLKDKLSPIEMPKIFEFRESPLPKTMIGKLSRKDILKEEAQPQEEDEDDAPTEKLAKAG